MTAECTQHRLDVLMLYIMHNISSAPCIACNDDGPSAASVAASFGWRE